MKKQMLAAAGSLALGFLPGFAGATPIYFATGTLAQATDLSGLTYSLENGQPQNILGGLGSGLAYVGGNTFVGVPDRGPNAITYNNNVDSTTSFISRVETLNLALTPSGVSGGLPFTLSPQLTGTTLLWSGTALNYGSGAGLGNTVTGSPLPAGNAVNTISGEYYFTGRSDNFNPATNSGDPLNARFDPESVRVAPDGKSVFISDEYGPYIRQFDRATGQLLKTYSLPSDWYVSLQSSVGQTEIDGNKVGRVANKGMEGLALTPDGKTLVGIIQAPLEQDPANSLRIVTIDVASGKTTGEYVYKLTQGSGVSDIVALNNHQFLVDERDGKGLGDGSSAKVKQLYVIDTNGASDLLDTTKTVTVANATPVSKSGTPFLDLVSALKAAGVDPTQIPSKIEGITLGQDVAYNNTTYHTLWLANDNDFVSDTSGPNRFYVFGFTDADLAQFGVAVPEPSTWAVMIAGLATIGVVLRRRRARVTTALALS